MAQSVAVQVIFERDLMPRVDWLIKHDTREVNAL